MIHCNKLRFLNGPPFDVRCRKRTGRENVYELFARYQGNEYYITKSYTRGARVRRKSENCNLKFARLRRGRNTRQVGIGKPGKW